jgi:hypothetical protein
MFFSSRIASFVHGSAFWVKYYRYCFSSLVYRQMPNICVLEALRC